MTSSVLFMTAKEHEIVEKISGNSKHEIFRKAQARAVLLGWIILEIKPCQTF